MSKPYIFNKIQSAPEHHTSPRFYNPMITNSLHNLINVKKQGISILRIKKSTQNRKKSTKFNPKNEKIGQIRTKNEQKTTLLFVPITPKQSSDFKHSYPRNRIEKCSDSTPRCLPINKGWSKLDLQGQRQCFSASRRAK